MPRRISSFLLSTSLICILALGIPQANAEDVEIEGTLRILHADGIDPVTGKFDHKKSQYKYILDEDFPARDNASPRSFILRMDKNPKLNLQTGQKVRIKGQVTEEASGILALATTGTTGTVQALTTYPTVQGVQNTLLMLLSFQDSAQTCSKAQVEDIMFTGSGSVNNVYLDSSYNKVSFAGTAVPLSINNTATTCDYTAWQIAGDQAATAAGINLSNYPRRVYVMPPKSQGLCSGWGGLGYIGGSVTQSWIFYCNQTPIYIHELGHNIGMHHAATASYEYGDSSDPMSGAYLLTGHNAPHKVQMGWLPSTQIMQVKSSGTYKVSMLASNTGNPQVLVTPKFDTGEDYYFSLRQPVGFDRYLPAEYQSKLNIHRWSGYNQTYYITSVDVGQSYTDVANGVSVTLLGVDQVANTADVNVTVTGDTTPPTVPSNLLASKSVQTTTAKGGGRNKTSSSTTTYTINLSWGASTDNRAVAGYNVFRNGVKVTATAATSFSEKFTTAGSYTYYVSAYDAAGNVSPTSNVVTMTTP